MAGVKRANEGKDKAVSKKPKVQDAKKSDVKKSDVARPKPNPDGGPVLNGTTSREAHAKQKQEKLERRAAKPNADSIARSKKLWERLRRKSHVPKQERDELVKELFDIISGRVQEFVFKHDAVRVIQCAIKYASREQKRQIARELQGQYRVLAESKYAKFLIARLVVDDQEIRDIIVPEFYGHVKRLIRNPEASWIMDDIYRSIATKEQKATMLREWYGPEFVVFKAKDASENTADLQTILDQSPEKRSPIMQHLKELTNQLVQKKTTGYTMLHDALLQYFLNCTPGTPEFTEFLDMLRDDEEGDCFKNLAFTKSGSRLVCLALGHGSSKDRRTILKFFKTHIKLLAGDPHGHLVLLAALEVTDDTVMSAKAVLPELLSKDLAQEAREQELLGQVEHLTARIPLLYWMSPTPPKWLLNGEDIKMLQEVHDIRKLTSKKDPETRRVQLLEAMSQPLLDLIAARADVLVSSSFGCQFVTEVLFGSIGQKEAALAAVVSLGDLENSAALLETPHAGRLLKTLVQGGRFDQMTKAIVLVKPPLKFGNLLYEHVTRESPDRIVDWALGLNSFVVLAMLEAADFQHTADLQKTLLTHRKQLTEKTQDGEANAGTEKILEAIGHP